MSLCTLHFHWLRNVKQHAKQNTVHKPVRINLNDDNSKLTVFPAILNVKKPEAAAPKAPKDIGRVLQIVGYFTGFSVFSWVVVKIASCGLIKGLKK